MSSETEKAASHVRAARASLETDPEKTAFELEAAADSLEHLRSYYLPLLEARERAQNAYRHCYLGKIEGAQKDLDRVEEILIGVAKASDGYLLFEMEEPLESLEDARAALEADPTEAFSHLEELAARLNSFLVKGGLILAE